MLFDILNAYRQAFRSFVRRWTRPKTIEEAEEKRLFWAKCYAVCGILSMFAATYVTAVKKPNAFGFKEGVPKEEAILDNYASQPTRLIKFHNFSKVDDYVYVPEKLRKNAKSDPEEEKELLVDKV